MMARNDPRWAYLLVILSTLLWGTNITLGRALRAEIGPVTLTAARFLVGGLVFAGLLSFRSSKSTPHLQPARRSEWFLWAGMSLTGVLGFPILLYMALQYTTASRAALINATGPLITAFLAALILRERITPGLLVGSLISLLGVALVIFASGQGLASGESTLTGDLLALITAILWGAYSILARFATRTRSSMQVTAYSAWLALPVLLLLAALEWRTFPLHLTPQNGLAAVYIGIFPTVIAFFAWNEGVRRVGPNQAMAFYNLLPVFGTMLAVVFLGESLSWLSAAGGLLVISGGLMVALWRDGQAVRPAAGKPDRAQMNRPSD